MASSAAAAPNSPRPRAEGELRDVCVLVIDDEPDTRDSIEMWLTRFGHTVATAANGFDALNALRTIRPSLILLDIQMPLMDGAEFREKMRHDRDLLAIPTIVMTGTTYEPMLDLAVEQTLTKPIRPARLTALVARHCKCAC